ncbi:MAG: choice-of-anchor D domain-containing protein [Nannocystaceae bacterium]|nr:choice-of-anchor D domain-containing protein [Nannocystaceae bacterium]
MRLAIVKITGGLAAIATTLACGGSSGDGDATAQGDSSGANEGDDGVGPDDEAGDSESGGRWTVPLDCPAPSGAATNFVDALEHLGRAQGDTFIEILDVVADGELVYSCTATQGLTIWDATNPSESALIVENVGPAGLAHDSFPRCQHLGYDATARQMVLTNRGDEIQPEPWLYLYDISDPASPVPLRGLQTAASIEGVVLEDGRIWAAAHNAGILVFDDTGEADLVVTAEWADDDSDAWAPFKVGDTLFVAEGTTGLRAYDIAGDTPILLDTIALPGSSKDVVVADGIAYVAASSFLAAVDVSDPTAMALVTEREVRGTALALDIGTDGIVMVAEWDEIRGYDTATADLAEVISETIPADGASFSRVLTLDAEPTTARVYAGEWRGMHAYDQHAGGTGPEVLATPGSLQFGTVAPGDSEDRVMVLRNSGDQPLEIYAIQSEIPGVSAAPACATIAPGSAAAFEVTFAPTTEDSSRGRLMLQTNDIDEPMFEVSMSGNIAGLDIGDPAPPFTLNDLDGQTWSLEDLEGSVSVLSYFATF